MPTTEQYVVEFVVDDSQLVEAAQQLQNVGKVDEQIGKTFKTTTAEINKQAAATDQLGKSGTGLIKNFDDLAKTVKGTASSFQQGFKEGIEDTLKEAGVSIVQLKQQLGLFKKESPFDKLNKDLAATKKSLLDNIAALQKLKATGGVDTERFKQLTKEIDLNRKELEKLKTEYEAVNAAADGLTQSTTQSAVAQESLKTKFRELTAQMGALKLAGKDNTEQYEQLREEAARVQDAIGKVSTEVRNAAADAPLLEGLIQGFQGIAGAAAIGQGAVALFGDQSEEMQEVLLKVNATMAILQGLQAVDNVLKKESAASLLIINTRQKIQNAQLAIENGLQSRSIIVRGGATAAQYALNAAMAANPIGILVVALAGLIALLATYGASAAEAARQTNSLNAAIRSTGELLNEEIEAIENTSKQRTAILELEGKKRSEINKAELEDIDLIIESRERAIQQARRALELNPDADLEQRQALIDQTRKLDDQLSQDRRKKQLAELKLQKQIQDEQKEAAEKAAEEEKKRQDELREATIRRLQDELAAIQIKLLAAQKGSQDEIDLQKQVIAKRAEIELQAEKLTANQKALIQKQSQAEQLELQKEFNEQSTKIALEGLIARNNATLTQLELNDEERLRIQIENIITAAQIETDAAAGNAAKIKEINAKRDQEIRDLRLKSIQDALNFELRMAEAVNDEKVRGLEKIAADEDAAIEDRIDAINQLTNIELDAIEKRVEALNRQFALGLIGQKEYNLQYQELINEQTQAVQEAEAQKEGIVKDSTEKMLENTKRMVDTITQIADQAARAVDDLFSLQSERELVRITEAKQNIEDLRNAGAISEKEAIARMRKLEAEERKIKAQQAQRDKQVAVFNALIAIPAAYLRGLAQGGLPLALIYAALAGAQLGLVLARPVPKFNVGKQRSRNYEGPGMIAEHQPEIHETNGVQKLYTKPTMVWVNNRDVIYNPSQTRELIERSTHKVDRSIMSPVPRVAASLDAEEMADHLARAIRKLPGANISIDENGFNVSVRRGLDTINYLNKRYSSKC